MGYCYQGRKLCCDICGNAGACKRRCPVGYCQAVACCARAECKAKLREYRKTTCASECVKASARFHAEEALKAGLIERGFLIRCAAVQVDGFKDCVKVWFEDKFSRDHIRYMATKTYHAFELLRPTTEGEYMQHGEVASEPKEFASTVAA